MDVENTIGEWAKNWQSAGIGGGDTVLVHSNVIRLVAGARGAGIAVGPADVLESFRRAVGPQGTLLLPLFNFDFTKGVPFDMRKTPSRMGVLTEAARLAPGAVRTGHPIYSFAVLGRQAALFKGLENFSGYGADSPFGKLRELDGKVAVLDLSDNKSMTFYHHVEEMENVPYRFHKKFTGLYTDESGCQSEKTFGLFVRKLDMGVQTSVDPMGEHLWQLGLYQGCRPAQGHGLRVIRARVLFDATAKIIRSGRAEGMLYQIAALNPANPSVPSS